MKALVNPTPRGDDYLVSKFGKLQQAALFAQADIRAIPEAARPDEENEAIRWAIAPVERLARLMQLLEPSTNAGARMVERATAWLKDGSLHGLLEPMEIAA